MIKLIKTCKEWQEIKREIKGSIGFVPTMGALHAGHISLIEKAALESNNVVVSIFVNPTQFNDKKDFELYQRTVNEDCKKLENMGNIFVFAPSEKEIYPCNYEIRVTENNIANILEGKFRKGHFDGMLSIVLKLLNIVGANKAYFGEKDYQQLLLVKKMVKSFFIDTKIIACPTVREKSGLALSSRNSRLSNEDRKKAALIYKYLSNFNLNIQDIENKLTKAGFKIEYITEKWGRRLIAAQISNVRLIDNVKIIK